MSKVRVHISTSLDGYVAGPNQSQEDPLGEGGERLHDWVVGLKAWREAERAAASGRMTLPVRRPAPVRVAP